MGGGGGGALGRGGCLARPQVLGGVGGGDRGVGDALGGQGAPLGHGEALHVAGLPQVRGGGHPGGAEGVEGGSLGRVAAGAPLGRGVEGGEDLHSLLMLVPVNLLVAGGELGPGRWGARPWPADLNVPHLAPLAVVGFALLDQMLDLRPALCGVGPEPVADVLPHRRERPAPALQVGLQPLPPRNVVGRGGAEAEVGVLSGQRKVQVLLGEVVMHGHGDLCFLHQPDGEEGAGAGEEDPELGRGAGWRRQQVVSALVREAR